jgi:hypothetical protein
MFEECPTQVGAMAHTATNPLCLAAHLLEVLADEVRQQISTRQMTPKIFHGVEFGRVGRHVFHCQPGCLLPQVGLDIPAAMRRQPIPQQNRLSPPEVTFEGPQIIEDLWLLDRAGVKSHTESNSTSRRRSYQAGDGRQSLPIEGHDNERGLSPRSPRAPHRRTLGKAAFVQENQQDARVAGFFLIRGQRYFSQRRMAASSRSRARRSGLWQLQPNCPKSFHTWPG